MEVPEACKAITGWAKQRDFPRPQEFIDLGLYLKGGEEPFLDSFPCVPGDKLGGWPFWIQVAEYHHCRRCRTLMTTVLFQLESEHNLSYWFGQAGIGWILQCPKDKDVMTFTWQC